MVKITDYAKNVAKSAGYAFVQSTKDSYSNIAAFSDTNSELFREAYDGIRNHKSLSKRIASKFKESPAFEISSMYIKNALEDIKTGDFYNEARVADYETKYGGDLFNIGDFDLPELGFDPDQLDNLNIQDGDLLVSRAIVKSNKISSNSIASAIMRGNQASIESSKEIASMFYTQNIEISKQISNTVGTVNSNMITGFKDVTEIAKTMSEQQAKFFTDTSSTLKSIDDKLSSINSIFNPKSTYKSVSAPKHTIDSVFTGGLDLKAYAKEIRTRGVNDAISQIPLIGSFLNPEFLKQMDGMMGGSMFRQATANPMQAVMNAIVGGMIPKGLKKSMETLDASVGSFFPAFIGRMNSMAKDNGWGTKSTVNRMIGKLFGLDTDAKTGIKYQEIKGAATAWDDMSKHYLEEVIPYYLRKMTAAITGESEMIFDTKSGKWKSVSSVRKDFKDDISSQYKRPFRSAINDYDTAISDMMSGMTFSSAFDKKQFEKDYDAFKRYVYRQGDINLKGKTARDLGMSSDRNLNIIRQAMLEMEPHVTMDLIAEIQSSKQQTTRKYQEITKGTALYKLFTEGEDLDFTREPRTKSGSTVDRHKDEKRGPNATFNLTKLTDDYNQTIYDYLRTINSNIEFFKSNGMITYPQGGYAGSPMPQGPINPSGRNIPSGYMDRVNATNTRYVSNTERRQAETAEREQAEEQSYADSLRWLSRGAGRIIVDSNTEMEEILANMQRAGAEKRKEARQELEDGESIFSILTDGATRREKNREKFKELTSFKDKWASSESIGEKVFLVKDKLQSWIDAPSKMMEKAILAADKHLFDLLYRTSTQMTDDEGRPVEGFMGLIKFKAMETFNTVKDTVTDLFGKAKDKFAETKLGKWLAERKAKMQEDEESPINKFKAAFKNQLGGVKNSYAAAFGRLGEAFGYQDYAKVLKEKRRAAAEEASLTPEAIGNILAFANTNSEDVISKLLNETDESATLRTKTMSSADAKKYNELRNKANKIAMAKKLRVRYQSVVDDPDASEAAKKVAQKKLDEIAKAVGGTEQIKGMTNVDLDSVFGISSQQDKLKQLKADNKNLNNELSQTDLASERVSEINKQINENNELIKATIDELKAINAQRKVVEEQLAEASSNADLVNQLSTNPFESLFAAADIQRASYQAELDKATEDLKHMQETYTQYNELAIAIHNQLTDPASALTADQISSMGAERDSYTAKANELRNTFIPQAKDLQARAQNRLNRSNEKLAGNIDEALKRFAIDSTVVNRLESERVSAYNKYDSQYSESELDPTGNENTYYDLNGQLRSRSDRDKLKTERDKYAGDLFSAEYGVNLDPKTVAFLAQFAKNKAMMQQFASTIQDPAMKAKFENALGGNYSYNAFGEVSDAAEVKYKDITNASMFARGGRNTSSKPKWSIMSPNEKIISPDGSVQTVSSTGIYKIPGKGIVVNPADDATIRKQAASEKAFKRGLLSNARVDDGLAKIKGFAKDVGYEGAARGAIGGLAGLLMGNPLLGAGIGVASQFIKSNKMANEALYGHIIDYDENGNPIRANDGFIKASIQKALPDTKTGGILGSALGLLTPLGPVGGALVGAGLGFLKNTQFAQDKIFGDGMLLSKDNRAAIKKAFPNIAIGAGLGALMGPFGLVGGALVGGSAGFLSTTEKFKTALLGEKQEDGSREGGVVGALKDNLVTPLKNFGLDMLDEMKENFKEDFLDPIKDAIAPITTELKNAFMIVPNMLADTFKEHVSVPLANLVRDYVATPIKKLTMGITKKAVDLIRLPFKLVGKGLFGGLGNLAKTAGIKNGRAGSYMTAAERNEFRQRNKGRFLVGDKYAEFDKNLAQYSETASVDDLELLKNSIAYNLDGDRGLNKEMGNNSRAIGKKISSKFEARFGNGARAINRAIEKGDYAKAFDLIRNTKTVDGTRMSKDEADSFIAEVQELLKQRDEILNKKETYKATDEQMAEYASKLGIKNFNKKSSKQKRAIMDALKAEINSKNAASIKYGSAATAEKRSEDLQANIYAENAEAVQASTNAFADFVAGLKHVTTFMNGIGNFENLEQNAVYNNGQGINGNQLGNIRDIQNTYEDAKFVRENIMADAEEASGIYDRETEKYLDTHVKKLLKFKLYSKINERNCPAIFDITAEDRVRLLNDIGDRGWFVAVDAINDFLNLSESDANKVYNIAKMSFTGKKKFVFDTALIDTICTLTKKESTKLGNNISEENVHILKTYKEDPAGLKEYIATFSNKSTKFREFNLKANLSASNNGVLRSIGRGMTAIGDKIKNSPLGNVFNERNAEAVRNVFQNIDDSFTGNSLRYRVSSNYKQDTRRDDLINQIANARQFKNDPRYTPSELQKMTTDELDAIIKQLPTNAYTNDNLSGISPEKAMAYAAKLEYNRKHGIVNNGPSVDISPEIAMAYAAKLDRAKKGKPLNTELPYNLSSRAAMEYAAKLERAEAGSKEEAEAKKEETQKFSVFHGIKSGIDQMVGFFAPKKEEEHKESFFSKLMKGVGKIFGIGKYVVGVPLIVGALKKWVVPVLKDTIIPGLVGEKQSDGTYSGGIASGLINGFNQKVVPWVEDVAVPKVKSVLGELWQSGLDTLKNDVLPTVMDYLMDNLPNIIESAATAAWELIKSGTKSILKRTRFGESGKTKANSQIAADTSSTTGAESISKTKYNADSIKAGGTKEDAAIAYNNANAEAYNKGVGTDYLNANYASTIAANEAFQSIRDKEAQATYDAGYSGTSIPEAARRSFMLGAAGLNGPAQLVTKGATKVFGLASKVPGLGIVGRLGQGAMKVVELPGKAGGAINKWVTSMTTKATSRVAAEVAEEAVEKGTGVAVKAAAGAANAGEKATLLTKVTTFLKTVLSKLFGNSKVTSKIAPLAEKVGMSKAALGKKLASVGDKLATKLAAKLGLESAEVLAKILGKATVVIAIAQAVIDFLMGWDNARNILGIVNEEVSVFERYFAGMANVVSGLTCCIIPADWLAGIFIDLYSFLGIDFAEAIKKKQEEAKEAIDLYNAENGTDFETVEDFNRAVNPTVWQGIKSKTKEWFTKASNGLKSVFGKDKDEADVKSNAYANDGLSTFNVDDVDAVFDEALAMNAYANDKLMPASKQLLNTTAMNPIDQLINSLTGGKNIAETMTKYQNMNKQVNTQISDGTIKTNSKRYWEINVGGDTTFAASLFKLSEFMRRAISSPLTIIQDAINSVFDTEVSAVTSLSDSEVSSSATGSSPDLSSYKQVSSGTMNYAKSTATTKKKGKIASFFSNVFKSGKGSEFKNRKLKYAIAPKPLDDDQASYLKAQYSGGANPHLYQRDYNDRFNISGDSNFQSIADSGCGPVVASEVLARRGIKYDVRDAAKSALDYKERNGGTFPEFFGDYLGRRGVGTSNVSTRSDLRRRLANGEDVILMGQSGRGATPFGSENAHYVLATGMKNGQVEIQDPENPNGNALYNANDTIRDSLYAISTGKGKGGRLRGFGGGRYKSGKGTLTATQENNLYNILHEIILSNESSGAGGYAAVNADDCGSLSVGSIQFHGNLAKSVLEDIAARVTDADDRKFLINVAAKGENAIISSSDASKLKTILEKYESVSKDVQDKHAFELYKERNFEHPLKLYSQGILNNPLSMIIPADIYNTGIHTGWADGWKPAHKGGTSEIEDVESRMLSSSWWATSGSQYRAGWLNRIKKTAEIVKGINIDNYTPGTICSGYTGSSGSTSSTDGSTSSTSNTFASKLGEYVKKVLTKIYGSSVFEALFGSTTTVSAAEVNGVSLSGTDYLSAVSGNNADSWFLETMPGSSMSSGYRTSGRPDHAGIDYAAPERTKIYSPVDGSVVFSGWNTGGYGNLVIIQDTHGFYHIFGHQYVDPSQIVSVGTEVARGTYIGQVGNTGESFGSHLHYQVNQASDMWHADVDPNSYDYSEYIKNAESRVANASVVPSESSGYIGPVKPNADGTSPLTATGLVKSATGIANKKIESLAKNGYTKKADTKSAKAAALGKNIKRAASTDIDKAISALSNADKSGCCGDTTTTTRQMPGAASGSNKLHTGTGEGCCQATNEILLAVVKLLTDISGNTSKLEDVVAAVTRLSVSNAAMLTGESSKSKSGKSNASSDNVMAELSKALLASSGMSTAAGLNSLNTQFQKMNNSQIIDAVYNIARQ